MTPQDEVVSFDLSVDLKTLGYHQDKSFLYWVKDKLGLCLYQRTDDPMILNKFCRISITCEATDVICAAPSATELWGRFPGTTVRDGRKMWLVIRYNGQGQVMAGYIDHMLPLGNEPTGVGGKLPDALAELWKTIKTENERRKG